MSTYLLRIENDEAYVLEIQIDNEEDLYSAMNECYPQTFIIIRGDSIMIKLKKLYDFILYTKNQIINNVIVFVSFSAICIIFRININDPRAVGFYDGVLASILASILFELYKNFHKRCEIDQIKKKYYSLFNVQLNTFAFRIASDKIAVHVACNCDINSFEILATEDILEKLRKISGLMIRFDEIYVDNKCDKKIYYAKVKNRIGRPEEYDEGVDFYFLIKESYLKDLHPYIEEFFRVLPFYFEDDDYKLHELMFNVHEMAKKIFINYPSDRDAFYAGQPLVSFRFINSLISLLIELAEHIRSLEK